MKKGKKYLAAVSAALMLATAGLGAVSAAEEKASVSPALSIISGNIDMVKTGLCGNEIRFTAKDFEDALGVSELDSVVIISLPSAVSGKLMLGSLEVMKNQTISKANLSALRFVPQSSEKSECNFVFRAGNAQKYDVTCTIHVIESQNFAPTAAGIDADYFQLMTYKNIAVFGNMIADDPEDDILKYEIVSYPKKGILSVTDKYTGEFIYTPTKNYTGKDSFTYTVTDAYGNRSDVIKMDIKISRSEHGTVFDDLIGQNCHNSAIMLSDLGIMTGKIEGEKNIFDPEGSVSRAEFLVMSMKIAGIDISGVSDSAVSVFSDDGNIPSEYKNYVIAAYNMGYIKGYDSDGELVFHPQENVTVAEACVMLNNIINIGKPVTKPVFSDSDSIPSWAEDAISALCAAGIVNTRDGYVMPSEILTRADAAEILAAVANM